MRILTTLFLTLFMTTFFVNAEATVVGKGAVYYDCKKEKVVSKSGRNTKMVKWNVTGTSEGGYECQIRKGGKFVTVKTFDGSETSRSDMKKQCKKEAEKHAKSLCPEKEKDKEKKGGDGPQKID